MAKSLRLWAIAVLSIALMPTSVMAGDDPAFLSFSVGSFDVIKNDDSAVEFRAEYRSDFRWLLFKPFVGATVTTDGGTLVFAGIYSDYYFGRRIVVSPSIAPSYFNAGSGKDLGNELEFRSQLEVAYRLDDRSRIGVSFNHISNAGLGDTNNGSESLAITYSFPLPSN